MCLGFEKAAPAVGHSIAFHFRMDFERRKSRRKKVAEVGRTEFLAGWRLDACKCVENFAPYLGS
jgi:hypothetical protein